MKQIQPFQKHWLQLTSIVVCRLKSIAIESVPAKQVGMDVNTIIGDVVASRNSQTIELSSGDDPTWVADWVSGALRV